MNKINKYAITFILISLIISVLSYILINKSHISEISYLEFREKLEKKEVVEVRLDSSSQIKVKLSNGDMVVTDNPRIDDFKEDLLLNGIKVVEGSKTVTDIVIFSGLSLVLAGIIIFSRRDSSKETEKEMNKLSQLDGFIDKHSLRFSDVAGNHEAKETLMEMVDFIQNPDKYSSYGARLPRGVLLYGPPGTGKTLLAKALAGEADVPIFPVSGSDFVQVYAGLGASRIRNLFKDAKEAGKSVIFIDEIDSLGKKRKGNNLSGSDESDRTLNALLAEMSGFKGNEGIIVLAATNRIDVLDEALLRPGRFDRQLRVDLPDLNAREEILKLHTRNKPFSKNIDFRKLAKDTIYFSGAKLENLVNESAMLAAKNLDSEINSDHIDRAYYKVLVGDEKKDRSGISHRDREITAYHEAGHALVTKLIAKENRVAKVSIIPSSGGLGGFSLNISPEKMYQTKEDMINSIKIALAGRAAEEIIFGKDCITTGASSDLEKSTNIVMSMICIYGMDEGVGLLNYNALENNGISVSRDTIDKGRKILHHLYSEVTSLLSGNKDKLIGLADALLEHESLDEEEIDDLIFGKESICF